MFNILALVSVFFIIALIIWGVYYLLYTSRINKAVHDGKIRTKSMIGVPKMTVIIVIILLLLISVSSVLSSQKPMIFSRNNYAVIDIDNYQFVGYSSRYSLDDASFAKVYSKDENEGYLRNEYTEGDFNFIVFTSKTAPDDFHPDFICFATYIGKEELVSAMSYGGTFEDIESKEMMGTSAVVEMTDSRTYMFMGNYDEDQCFKITMGVYNNDGIKAYEKEDNFDVKIEDFALSVGSMTIKR